MPMYIKARIKSRLKGLVSVVARRLASYPSLRRKIASAVRYLPWIDRKLRSAVASGRWSKETTLSPDAELIYRRLQARQKLRH